MPSARAREPLQCLGKSYLIVLETDINIEYTSKLIGILKYAEKKQVNL